MLKFDTDITSVLEMFDTNSTPQTNFNMPQFLEDILYVSLTWRHFCLNIFKEWTFFSEDIFTDWTFQKAILQELTILDKFQIFNSEK